MATENSQPSFSRGRKWKIGFDLLARTILVLAVVVMANYLGALFPHRAYLSSKTRVQLSSKTASVLQSLTNKVAVTVYYKRGDDFYPDVIALLNEYRAANPKISIRVVDYVRDGGDAQLVKEHYKQFFTSPGDKNLVIFDSDGRVKIAYGDALVNYGITGFTKDKQMEISAVTFNAEQMFTSILLTLESDRQFKAYFLQGHGEPSLDDTSQAGYSKFASILQANYVDVQPLHLSGENDVPADCNLLVIAGPQQTIPEEKINRYLSEGGRAFMLLDYTSVKQPTGLENVLAKWNINVVPDIVSDKDNASGSLTVVQNFQQHPIVNPLLQSELEMLFPRPVVYIAPKNPSPDAPSVTEIAFSGPRSTLIENPAMPPHNYPLIATIEQKSVAGVVNPRGTLRMVITGDSQFLDNQIIEGGLGGANRDFLANAINWLLDRPNLLQGIGPKPLTEFRLTLTETQQREVNWLLIGALPGAVLLLGGLVWFVRRK